MSDRMDNTELVFQAILYPFFFYKLINKVSGYGVADELYWKVTTNDGNKAMEDMHNDAAFKRQIMLLSAGIAGIISASFIKTNSTKLGIGLGGVITLILALALYWSKYMETTKIVIAGICLLLIVFLSMRLYKIDNIADIFSFEFGTK